jgi:hypothetical protein
MNLTSGPQVSVKNMNNSVTQHNNPLLAAATGPLRFRLFGFKECAACELLSFSIL